MRAINDTNAPKRLVLIWRLQSLANTAKQKIRPLLEFSGVFQKYPIFQGSLREDPRKHMSMSNPEMAKSGGNFWPISGDFALDLGYFKHFVP